MKYSKDEVIQFVMEEDVKFIRLAFCDVFGKQKNISIMPQELKKAFEYGIPFDASAVRGFTDEAHSDLFLHPDPETLQILPWRPESGRVVRMYSDITYPDGTPFEGDSRAFLKKACKEAEKAGFFFEIGSEQEFYLFKLDDEGNPSKIPYDNAGYLDIAPDDKGENIRREICLTLEQMGIVPESSHHEQGPGQNEISFRYADPLTSADNTMTFQTVVKTTAGRNGLQADFSPKPVMNAPGSGFHIHISVKPDNDSKNLDYVIAGIMERIEDMTLFLNRHEDSYKRLGKDKTPTYISWAHENRSQLIRIPAAQTEKAQRAELRSPDPLANPYLAFALIIYAALEGIKNKKDPGPAVNLNLFTADSDTLSRLKKLPVSLEKAKLAAQNSEFIAAKLPDAILKLYLA